MILLLWCDSTSTLHVSLLSVYSAIRSAPFQAATICPLLLLQRYLIQAVYLNRKPVLPTVPNRPRVQHSSVCYRLWVSSSVSVSCATTRLKISMKEISCSISYYWCPFSGWLINNCYMDRWTCHCHLTHGHDRESSKINADFILHMMCVLIFVCATEYSSAMCNDQIGVISESIT